MRSASSLKSKIKYVSEPLGLSDFLRQAYVETRLIGERIKFAVAGRPQPSSTILLAGSGRSGTTWITDMLCALDGIQQIFEPLHPYFTAEVRSLNPAQSISGNACVSTYIRPDAHYPQLQNFLYRVLTGRVRNYMTDYIRNSYFTDRFLIKEIRANLMIGFIARHFKPRIVFIMRHPCAVVYSRLKVHWRVDIKDILLQEELVEDYLRPWVKEVEQIRDSLSCHALWWALENRVAMDQLKDFPHRFIYYENAVLEPRKTIEGLCAWLQIGKIPSSKLTDLFFRPSRMARKDEPYRRNMERLSWWKKKLSKDCRKKILLWTSRLGVVDYDDEILPLASEKSKIQGII